MWACPTMTDQISPTIETPIAVPTHNMTRTTGVIFSTSRSRRSRLIKTDRINRFTNSSGKGSSDDCSNLCNSVSNSFSVVAILG